jgi:hypothetical protein
MHLRADLSRSAPASSTPRLHALLPGIWEPEFAWLARTRDALAPRSPRSGSTPASTWSTSSPRSRTSRTATSSTPRNSTAPAPGQRFRHVVLPDIRPVAAFVTLLSVIGSFQTLRAAAGSSSTTAPGPANRGLTVMMYLYQTGFHRPATSATPAPSAGSSRLLLVGASPSFANAASPAATRSAEPCAAKRPRPFFYCTRSLTFLRRAHARARSPGPALRRRSSRQHDFAATSFFLPRRRRLVRRRAGTASRSTTSVRLFTDLGRSPRAMHNSLLLSSRQCDQLARHARSAPWAATLSPSIRTSAAATALTWHRPRRPHRPRAPSSSPRLTSSSGNLGLLNTYAGLLLPAPRPRLRRVSLPSGHAQHRARTSSSRPPASTAPASSASSSTIVILPLVRPMLGAFLMISIPRTRGIISSARRSCSSQPELHPLSVALNNLRGLYATDYGLIMAGTLVSIAPVMCLFLLLPKRVHLRPHQRRRQGLRSTLKPETADSA